jgi:hypothetical protein
MECGTTHLDTPWCHSQLIGQLFSEDRVRLRVVAIDVFQHFELWTGGSLAMLDFVRLVAVMWHAKVSKNLCGKFFSRKNIRVEIPEIHLAGVHTARDERRDACLPLRVSGVWENMWE